MLKIQWNHRLQTALVMLLLFLATWVPRVVGLDRAVTVDERKWIARGANFYYAMWEGDFPDTLQTGHPGIPIMWAGALSFIQFEPGYVHLATNATADGDDIETWLREHSAHPPLEILARGRWWVVLMIAFVIAASYLPLRRLFGVSVAVLISLFVAWDPFMLALSRQLHPDSLVANLAYLACLYFLIWLYVSRTWRILMMAGVILGLAWLTKVPTILLAPAGALLVLFELGWPKSHSPSSIKQWFVDAWRLQRPLIIGVIVWGLLAGITFVVFWPAMWTSPIFTLRSMTAEMSDYVAGHVSGNYFLGRTLDDPGPFFYPITYLFRTTPATLFGLLAALFGLWRRRWPFDRLLVRQCAWALIVFALIFMAGMTLGGKKFDRYVLPVFPLLDVVGVLGWISVAQPLVHWWRKPDQANRAKAAMDNPVELEPFYQTVRPIQLERQGVWVVLGATVFLHGLLGFMHYPEYLTYFNPLMGGSTTAPKVMMVGWGEGLDEAADWLNRQPGAENLRIASTYSAGPLSYFLHTKQPVQTFWTPDFWFNSDYAVLYVNQWRRRDLLPELVDYLSEQTPAHVVRLHGLEMARIYDMRGKTPPEFSGVYTDSAVNFANKIRLAAYSLGRRTFLSGDHFSIQLYLQSLAPLDKNYVVLLRLIAPNGAIVAHSERAANSKPTSTWRSDEVHADYYEVTVPADAPSGEYKIILFIYDPATPQVELATGLSGAMHSEHSHIVTSIQVRSARSYDINAQWSDVRLTHLQHDPKIKPDQPFFVDATATGKVNGSRKLSLRLVDLSGKTMAQADTALVTDTRIELSLPANAPVGLYTLVAVVYDPKTLAPLPDQAGNFTTTLAKIEYAK